MKELTLRELQLCCLEILKDVHLFCMKNNIKYSLQDGSLIGVIRHKGFIPWDDDIDIIMPRPDYLNFCQNYHSDKYELAYPERDRNCSIAFARVYDNKKTIAIQPDPWINREYGVSIDIFPADGAYDNIKKANRYYSISRLWWKISCSCRLASTYKFSLKYSFLHNMAYILSVFVPAHVISRIVCFRAANIPYGSTSYWTQLTCMGDNSKEHHRIDTFDHCSLKPFENIEVMVMDGYDEVLKEKYNNYMELPPLEKRKLHSSLAKFYWK